MSAGIWASLRLPAQGCHPRALLTVTCQTCPALPLSCHYPTTWYLNSQFIDEDMEVRVRLFVQGHTDGRCRSGNARRPYRSDVHYFSLSPPCSSHHPSPRHLQMETQLWRLVPPNTQNIAISCGTLLHPRHVVIGSGDLGQAQRSPGWLKFQLYSLLAVWPWVSH